MRGGAGHGCVGLMYAMTTTGDCLDMILRGLGEPSTGCSGVNWSRANMSVALHQDRVDDWSIGVLQCLCIKQGV